MLQVGSPVDTGQLIRATIVAVPAVGAVEPDFKELAVLTIWPASNAVGLNTLGDSSPYAHSLSVNVFVVRCAKP